MSWIEAAIGMVVVLLLGAIVLITYNEHQRPTFEIKKDDWECVRSEQRTHLQPMLVGKVTILQPITKSVCMEYRRHADSYNGHR